MDVILASGSPRRLAILRAHGIEPIVVEPAVDEGLPQDVREAGPAALVTALALKKAQAVVERLQRGKLDGLICKKGGRDLQATGLMILAADTVVYKGRILGKPRDKRDAIDMLLLLRGTSHKVYTGVAVIDVTAGTQTTFYDETTVFFKDYSLDSIHAYIEVEPPYDKAGSYGIQGIWQAQVARIEGDLENVIGLPWHKVATEGAWFTGR